MIDLHTHTLFSDGVLLPAELARRAQVIGTRAIAFTDHVDFSNYDIVVPQIARYCEQMTGGGITVLAGVEITHEKPERIKSLVVKCRELGARIVLVHGQTIVEPVEDGANRMAITAGVDILAHPGLITEDDVKLAADRQVALEISGRGGHSFTNGHVARLAVKYGAPLVFNTDSHAPKDLMDKNMAVNAAKGAGMDDQAIDAMFAFSESLVERTKKNGGDDGR